jgi:hypothetical protein
MSAILNEDPPALAQIGLSVPPALQTVVHRCLEKSPEQRFQSASDLAFAVEASSDSGSQVSHIAPVDSGKRWLWIAASGIAILIAAALIAWWRLPLAVPQVQAVTQLTDDGESKRGRLVTDGSRIYFNEGESGSWRIAQVSVTGGQTGPVSTRLANPRIAALTPDNSALLAMASGSDDGTGPLWLIPLPVGEPRRVGGSEVQDASFFPDGRIAFAQGTVLFVAERNGSNPRKLAQLTRGATAPNVSPDGSRVAAKGVLQYRPSCLSSNPSPAHPVSSISAGRSSILNHRAVSGAVIGVAESRVNKSMSTAVASVLNAQNAVATCISGMGVIAA